MNDILLVVEDDPVLKNLLGTTFGGKYKVIYAGDGDEALAYIDQFKPALILLDLLLPGMSGFDVLAKVRARGDDLKSVPVVVVSNLSQQGGRQKAKELGANDYLVKAEVSVEEIEAKVKEFLK